MEEALVLKEAPRTTLSRRAGEVVVRVDPDEAEDVVPEGMWADLAAASRRSQGRTG